MEKPRDRGPDISPRRAVADGRIGRGTEQYALFPALRSRISGAYADRTDYRKRLIEVGLRAPPSCACPSAKFQRKCKVSRQAGSRETCGEMRARDAYQACHARMLSAKRTSGEQILAPAPMSGAESAATFLKRFPINKGHRDDQVCLLFLLR